MSTAAETENIAPNVGNVHKHTFFYEVSLQGPTNPAPVGPTIVSVPPAAWVKRHSLLEFGTTSGLGGGDTYVQSIVNTFLNMYKYFRYVKIICHFKPFYNYAPLPNNWVTNWTVASNTNTYANSYSINGDNQISARSIRKVIVNTDNTDWSLVSTLNYVRLLQTMTNTIRGTTIAELSWSYVPKLMTPMLQDFQTQGTATQLRKVESGGQWLPTKYYTPGTSTPAGFNPITMMGFDLIIYDPAQRGAVYAQNDFIGTLEFMVEMEFSILDDNQWIGTYPQGDSSTGAGVYFNGAAVGTYGQAEFDAN